MSISTSRYDAQTVVNAFNLFIDSERSTVYGHHHSTGDDVHVHLGGNSIETQDGEVIRLSLTNFTMFNVLYHVDNTNRRIRLRTSSTTGLVSGDVTIRLTIQNHNDFKSVVTDFAQVLGAALVTQAVAAQATTVAQFEASAIEPVAESVNASDTRLMQVTLTAKDLAGAVVAHNLGGVKLQCEGNAGESYQLLGGKRIDTASASAQSFVVAITATTVTVKGLFPMQRMSDPYVYVRCENASNGLEMSVLDSGVGASGSDVLNSNILGKVFRDVEFISYQSHTGNDYFVNLQQRRLSHLHLFLTDSKGRKLGRLPPNGISGTAAGRESAPDVFESDDQNTLGNLYFTAVVKVEVIRVKTPSHLDTTPPPPLKPAREAQGVVVWPDYGRPKH